MGAALFFVPLQSEGVFTIMGVQISAIRSE